jgi:PIN domain nuclease of toxin-antitoxin system
MKLLLDTHTVLWFYLADPQLSAAASTAIMDPANENGVSPASYWEVAIKISVGKYAIAQPFEDFWRNAIDMNAFQILHISPGTQGRWRPCRSRQITTATPSIG